MRFALAAISMLYQKQYNRINFSIVRILLLPCAMCKVPLHVTNLRSHNWLICILLIVLDFVLFSKFEEGYLFAKLEPEFHNVEGTVATPTKSFLVFCIKYCKMIYAIFFGVCS